MKQRLLHSFWALGMMLDVVLCTLWLVPLYIVGLADKPTGRQLISAYVGRAAINGHRWAFRAERVIDFIVFWDRPNHCRRAARHYAGNAD